MIRVHHGQISIPKGGEELAREFYRDFLGLKEISKPDALKGRGGFWLQLGEVQIHFGVEDGVDRNATKAHLAYEVSDLEGWRKKLASRRIEVLDGIPIPGYERFEFRDPFGNRVEFLEPTGSMKK
jgi:catechol 2,3-dioxygenase-like lactoylglutathione lyase family enzyme